MAKILKTISALVCPGCPQILKIKIDPKIVKNP